MTSPALSWMRASAVFLGSFCYPAFAVDYEKDIRPILNSKCFQCHSGPRAKGSLRMDTLDHFSRRIGGDKPVIIPGDPANSLLPIKAGLPRTDGEAMPPPPARARGAEAMTTAELDLVKQWIAAGAKLKADDDAGAPAEGMTTTPAQPAAPSGSTEEIRQWSNAEGRTLEAAFVSFDGTNVTLKPASGEPFQYPLDKLSEASQSLVRQLAGAQ